MTTAWSQKGHEPTNTNKDEMEKRGEEGGKGGEFPYKYGHDSTGQNT